MSVLVKGMEMPKSCFYCPFRKKVNPDDYVCMALNKELEETFSLIVGKRHDDCPLIEVPGWTPVTERLPEEVGWYLVVVLAPFKQVRMYEFYPVHNNYGNDLWRNNDGDHVSNWLVTHWMPLPKPPEECEA